MIGMRQITHIAILALVFAFTLCGAGEAQVGQEDLWQKVQKEGVLRVGAAVTKPDAIKDPKTGEWSGVAIDILRQFADVLQVKLEVHDTTWDNMIAGLQAEKWDIAVALNRTPRRALAVVYSEPFRYIQMSFLYKFDNAKISPTWKSVGDFDQAGIKFAVISGTAQDNAITPLIKTADLIRFPDVDSADLAIMAGRADVLSNDSDTNALFVKAQPTLKAIFPDPAIVKFGDAFALRHSISLNSVQALDILIQQMTTLGIVQQLMDKYTQPSK